MKIIHDALYTRGARPGYSSLKTPIARSVRPPRKRQILITSDRFEPGASRRDKRSHA